MQPVTLTATKEIIPVVIKPKALTEFRRFCETKIGKNFSKFVPAELLLSVVFMDGEGEGLFGDPSSDEQLYRTTFSFFIMT